MGVHWDFSRILGNTWDFHREIMGFCGIAKGIHEDFVGFEGFHRDFAGNLQGLCGDFVISASNMLLS